MSVKSFNVAYHEDDRAQRLFDVFPSLEGQINISHVNSTEHVVAWHQHEVQIDYWFCVKGSFKVGLAFPTDEGYRVKWEYLSDKFPKMLKIPAGVYHGYRALEPNSIMLYYLNAKYDPNDVFFAKPGDFGEEWETEIK